MTRVNASGVIACIFAGVWRLLTYTHSFRCSKRKEKKSGDRGAQEMFAFREIIRYPKMVRRSAIVSMSVCAVIPCY